MKIILIAAVSRNGVIGKDGDIPWKLPNDMKHFKQTTTGHTVIMGRKTFESFGAKPLPKRLNVVVSRTVKAEIEDPNLQSFDDLDLLYNLWKGARTSAYWQGHLIDKKIFIIGGEAIYRKFLPIADEINLTIVNTDIEDGDTFFPFIDPLTWEMSDGEHFSADERHQYEYSFHIFKRINN